MYRFEDSFWKFMNIVHLLFGIYLTDYIEIKKCSKLKSAYVIILHVSIMVLSVYLTDWYVLSKTKTYVDILFSIIIIEEIIVLIILTITETSTNLAENDIISQNVKIIDDFLKIKECLKIQFKTKLTYFYLLYISYTTFTNVEDYFVWGHNFWLIFLKSKIYDLVFLKLIVMVHMHLCRLFAMNNQLKIILKLHKMEKNSNWLTSWRLLPKHMEICEDVKDLNMFLVIYSTLCENVTIISKKIQLFVSENL